MKDKELIKALANDCEDTLRIILIDTIKGYMVYGYKS